jgi:hypothetical protein
MRPSSSLDLHPRSSSNTGATMLVVLFIVFVVLKLTPPVQEWSWWWVTAPLWMPVAAAVVVGIVKALVS